MTNQESNSKTDHPNILLVILDSTRAKNCSTYGYKRETTPFLTEFAENSVLYKQARAPSIHSISSHASIFTGYHTEEHGITEHKSFVKPEETIWYTLSENFDYDTGLFTPNVIVSETSNLGDVFDTNVGPKRANFRLFKTGLAPLDLQGKLSSSEYIREALNHDAPVRSILNGLYKKIESRKGAQDPSTEHASIYINEFLKWIDSRSGPWAACLNLMDTHTPFVPATEYNHWGEEPTKKPEDTPEPLTDEFWDHLQDLEPLYDGTIRQADAAVERLIDKLSKADILDDTLVVITSDHGEGFGETCELDSDVLLRHHSWGIDEQLTHVPLIVRTPGESNSQTVSDLATLTNFPAAVEAAITGDDVIPAFVSEGDVISSTYRIKPPGNELSLPESRREKYFGPWRAVYRMTDAGVVKYTRRGDDAAKFRIPNAQEIEQVGETDDGVVDNVYGRIEDAGIRMGTAAERDMGSDVENRLEDLGYLR